MNLTNASAYKIKVGEVPTYIIPSNLISSNFQGKIIECVKEICCDEYLEYLKLIPKDYIIYNETVLLNECAKNNSKIATEHIWNINKKEITASHLYTLLAHATNKKYNYQLKEEYINWILDMKQFGELEVKISDTILNNCLKINNLKLFLKVYHSVNYSAKCILEVFDLAFSLNKIIFLEIIYEILMGKYKNEIKINSLIETLSNNVSNNTECFIWLYEKVKDKITNESLKKIYIKNFNLYEKMIFIESKIILNNLEIIQALKKYFSISNSIEYLDYPEELFNSFIHLYYKANLDPLQTQNFFVEFYKKNNVRYNYNKNVLVRKICHFLIDEGVEIDDFKNRAYDYYSLREQIKLKKLRTQNKNYFLIVDD